jgi:thiamine-phosphate pyrophosphorylase
MGVSDSLARRGLARAAAGLNAKGRHAGRIPSLILLTDDSRLDDPVAAVRLLPRGSIVIVRSRLARRRSALAFELLVLARQRGLVVLVAEDPLLARQCGADGLHLPESRAREAFHWRAQCPRWLITVAAHSLRAATQVQGADAVLLSPVFPTESHPDRAALSPSRANLIAQFAKVPVYALGGIALRNARLIAGTNYAGIAAISGLCA